jgi:hypothetical protein
VEAGVTDPAPSAVIVTLVAVPPKRFPLTVTGVLPQVLPLAELRTTLGWFTQPQFTSNITPVVTHPSGFTTEII